MSIDVRREVRELAEEMVFHRRDLHRHPETAFEEVRTADVVARHLTQLGYQVRTGIGKTGVVGVLDTGAPGPTVMVRADMDALPVHEVEGRPYGSSVAGKMHACGHDGHVAVSLAVTSILSKAKDQLNGRVQVVFQPAEEIISGARAMLEDGVLDDLVPDRVLGLHMWSPMEVGKVGVRNGPMWASVDEVRIVVRGSGGHGGLPHLSVDPVAVTAQLITTLQTLVSREVSPMEAGVVGFGSIHGGTQFNVIPDEVELRGNLRTLNNTVRANLLRRVEEVASQVTGAMRASCTVEHLRGTPAVDNNPDVNDVIRQSAAQWIGAENVVDPCEQSLVGDDVALFMERAPGAYFLVGCANPELGIGAPHHNHQFDIDERALEIGCNVLAGAALHYLTQR